MEIIRALAGYSDGLFFFALAFIYPGALATIVLVGLGDAVGQRAGATLAAVISLIVWVGPILFMQVGPDSVFGRAPPARWFYPLFALAVLAATLWTVWKKEPDEWNATRLARLRDVKQQVMASERIRSQRHENPDRHSG